MGTGVLDPGSVVAPMDDSLYETLIPLLVSTTEQGELVISGPFREANKCSSCGRAEWEREQVRSWVQAAERGWVRRKVAS